MLLIIRRIPLTGTHGIFSYIYPSISVRFWPNCYLPFIKPSTFGLFGFNEDFLLLTNSTFNGKAVHELKVPSVQSYVNRTLSRLVSSQMRCSVNNLNIINNFTAHCRLSSSSSSGGLLSNHLEQLSIACPNLE